MITFLSIIIPLNKAVVNKYLYKKALPYISLNSSLAKLFKCLFYHFSAYLEIKIIPAKVNFPRRYYYILFPLFIQPVNSTVYEAYNIINLIDLPSVISQIVFH